MAHVLNRSISIPAAVCAVLLAAAPAMAHGGGGGLSAGAGIGARGASSAFAHSTTGRLGMAGAGGSTVRHSTTFGMGRSPSLSTRTNALTGRPLPSSNTVSSRIRPKASVERAVDPLPKQPTVAPVSVDSTLPGPSNPR